MNGSTVEERVETIKFCYNNGNSAMSKFRASQADYGLHYRPTQQSISNTVKKF